MKEEGGQWRAEELAGYRVKEREPLRFQYRDWVVTTAPPPSSGGVALAEMLQILSGWDLAKLDDAQRTHLIVEAMRRAFRDRTIYLGDPDFVKMPLARLTSADYAAGLRATIHPDKATPSDLLPGEPAPLEDDETTHFSIIDARRQPRLGHADGEPAVRLGHGRAGHRRAAQQRDGRLRPAPGHAQCVRRDGLRRQRAGAGQAHAQLDDAELHRIRATSSP